MRGQELKHVIMDEIGEFTFDGSGTSSLRQEWAVRYRDPEGVMGAEKFHYIPVSDEAAAKNVASWHHRPWDDREKVVVRRIVGEWEEA